MATIEELREKWNKEIRAKKIKEIAQVLSGLKEFAFGDYEEMATVLHDNGFVLYQEQPFEASWGKELRISDGDITVVQTMFSCDNEYQCRDEIVGGQYWYDKGRLSLHCQLSKWTPEQELEKKVKTFREDMKLLMKGIEKKGGNSL